MFRPRLTITEDYPKFETVEELRAAADHWQERAEGVSRTLEHTDQWDGPPCPRSFYEHERGVYMQTMIDTALMAAKALRRAEMVADSAERQHPGTLPIHECETLQEVIVVDAVNEARAAIDKASRTYHAFVHWQLGYFGSPAYVHSELRFRDAA